MYRKAFTRITQFSNNMSSQMINSELYQLTYLYINALIFIFSPKDLVKKFVLFDRETIHVLSWVSRK